MDYSKFRRSDQIEDLQSDPITQLLRTTMAMGDRPSLDQPQVPVDPAMAQLLQPVPLDPQGRNHLGRGLGLREVMALVEALRNGDPSIVSEAPPADPSWPAPPKGRDTLTIPSGLDDYLRDMKTKK